MSRSVFVVMKGEAFEVSEPLGAFDRSDLAIEFAKEFAAKRGWDVSDDCSVGNEDSMVCFSLWSPDGIYYVHVLRVAVIG